MELGGSRDSCMEEVVVVDLARWPGDRWHQNLAGVLELQIGSGRGFEEVRELWKASHYPEWEVGCFVRSSRCCCCCRFGMER